VLLDRAGEQTLDEVTLQAEKNDQRNDHQQEGPRRKQVPFGAVLAEQALDLEGHRENCSCPARRPSAMSRSFQTHRNWKMPYAAIGGYRDGHDDLSEDPGIGRTRRSAPPRSCRVAKRDKKLRKRKIRKGMCEGRVREPHCAVALRQLRPGTRSRIPMSTGMKAPAPAHEEADDA